MSLDTQIDPIERQIAERLIDDVLGSGASVSIFDGEHTTVRRSRDRADILAALGTTDSDVVRIHTASAPGTIHHAWVLLIWGNGFDLISDSTVTAQPWLEGAEALAEQLAEAA